MTGNSGLPEMHRAREVCWPRSSARPRAPSARPGARRRRPLRLPPARRGRAARLDEPSKSRLSNSTAMSTDAPSSSDPHAADPRHARQPLRRRGLQHVAVPRQSAALRAAGTADRPARGSQDGAGLTCSPSWAATDYLGYPGRTAASLRGPLRAAQPRHASSAWSSRRASTIPTRRSRRPSRSGRAPTGWSARSSTCTASVRGPSRPAADLDARGVHRLSRSARTIRCGAAASGTTSRGSPADESVSRSRPEAGSDPTNRHATTCDADRTCSTNPSRTTGTSEAGLPGRSTSGRSIRPRTRRCGSSSSSTASGSSRRRPTSAISTRASRSSANTSTSTSTSRSSTARTTSARR